MKTIFLGMCMLLLTLPGMGKAPWGGRAEEDPRTNSLKPQEGYYILRQLSSGKPIRIHMEFEDPSGEDNRSVYEREIVDAYTDWFKMAEFYIEKNGDPKKFVRVLQRLRRKPNIQFVAAGVPADLQVEIAASWQSVQAHCVGQEQADITVDACISRKEEIPKLYMPDYWLVDEYVSKSRREKNQPESSQAADDYFRRTLCHELGHTLGLADQYYSANPEVVSHERYRSSYIRDGIMNTADNFTCDDADGLINLIDAIYQTEPSRKRGWPSLCKGSAETYLNGIPQGVSPYVIKQKDELHWIVRTYKQGKKVAENTFALDGQSPVSVFSNIPDGQILQEDWKKRPVLAKGPNGEDIYYFYNYGTVNRLITKNGKAVRQEVIDEYERLDKDSSQWLNTRFVYWRFSVAPGVPGNMTLLSDPLGASATYQEGSWKDPFFEVRIYINEEGTAETPEITKNTQAPPQVLEQTGLLAKHLQQEVYTQQQQWRIRQFQKWVQTHHL